MIEKSSLYFPTQAHVETAFDEFEKYIMNNPSREILDLATNEFRDTGISYYYCY